MIGKTVDWHVYVSTAISRLGGADREESNKQSYTIYLLKNVISSQFCSENWTIHQSSIHLYYSIMPIYTLDSSPVV